MILDTLAEKTRSRRKRPITELDGDLEPECGEIIDRIAGERHPLSAAGPRYESDLRLTRTEKRPLYRRISSEILSVMPTSEPSFR